MYTFYIHEVDDGVWAEVREIGTPVAIVVDLLLAIKASEVEFPPIIDLFKILRLVSVAVWNLAFYDNIHT